MSACTRTPASYLSHWRLRARPFERAADAVFFYAGRQHAEALERLRYLVNDGHMGIGLLTGEIGCGKTCVLSRLRERNRDILFISDARPGFDDLLREILRAMRRPGTGRRNGRELDETRYGLIVRFRELFVRQYARARRNLAILVDEAQQLDGEALVEIKNLLNAAEADGSRFSVVLAGQPELRGAVAELPQIEQRVGVRYHLRPLAAAEVADYVETRLRAAGCTTPGVFADDALAELARAAGGVPRLVNRFAKLALDAAFALDKRRIDAELVARIVHDSNAHQA